MYLSDYDSAGVSESHLEDIYCDDPPGDRGPHAEPAQDRHGRRHGGRDPDAGRAAPLGPRPPAPAPASGAPGGGWRRRSRRRQRGRRRLGRRDACGHAAGSASPDRPVGNRDQTPAGPTATDRTDPTSKRDAETTQLSHHWKEVPAPPGISAGRNKLVFLQDPTNPTELWIFKPAKGEQELTFGPSVGIEAQERWRRAEAASRLGKDLGFDTPDTHLVDWKGEKGSLQRYGPGSRPETRSRRATRTRGRSSGSRSPARTWTCSTSSSPTRIATARTG